MRKVQQGFTLIELLIVVAIIGILAAIAIPSYQSYVKKAKFAEVVQATSPFKLAVEACVADGSCASSGATAPSGISPGTNGFPSVPTSFAGNVGGLSVSGAGIIDATGATSIFGAGMDYSLTPSMTANTGAGGTANVQWAKGGACVAAGLC